MNSLTWRGRSRVVAYLDLIVGALALVGGVSLAALTALGHLNGTVLPDEANIIQKSNCLAVSLLGVTVVAITWQLYAAIQLLNGTELDADKQIALKKSRFWRNCSILFVVVIAAADFLLFGMFAMLLDVTFRLSMMFIVYQFIRELENIPSQKHFVLPTYII